MFQKENLITRGWIAPCKAIQPLKIITIIIFLLLAVVCLKEGRSE